MYFSCIDSLDGRPLGLPGGNEVLGQVDADRCSCDSDMTVTCSVQLAANLDLSSRHLPDFVDLSSLAADDRADQLRESKGETDQSVRRKINYYVDILERTAVVLYDDRVQ